MKTAVKGANTESREMESKVKGLRGESKGAEESV